jgi:hypothetical protein
MNKEQQELLDEVYENYKRFTHSKNEKDGNYGEYSKWGDNPLISGVQHLTKGTFIQMIKIDFEFSERWGLKIVETYDLIPRTEDFGDVIITKPIRRYKTVITYNGNTIESYE